MNDRLELSQVQRTGIFVEIYCRMNNKGAAHRNIRIH